MRAQPPKLIARAIKLRAAGMSYIEIAGSCGVTKGIVAGIMFRAGACAASPTRTGPRSIKRKAEPKPEIIVAASVAPTPPPARPPAPPRLRGGLECSWPMWADDTPRRERSYCGCATGGPGMSYCAEHWRMARRPARELARV